MGVFVVGMHRSGTSAVAAALQTLGLEVGSPADLMGADPANPAGYYELKEIGDFNDDVLARLGGRWDCPPQLHDGWENDASLTPLVRRAMTTKAARLPRERWLVKDPRITLLLPMWRRAVLDRCAAVLVVRNPMEVAWSVTLRNGIPTMTALALWSAYNRAALQGLGGLPVYVCTYDALLTDPRAAVGALAAALESWGELDAGADLDAAAARVRPDLRRSTWRRDAPDALDRPGEIDRLDKFLRDQAGPHDVFEPAQPPAAPWEHALLSERRVAVEQVRTAGAETARLRDERDRMKAQLDATTARVESLAGELTDANGHARDAEAGRLEQVARLAEANAALAQATERWDRLERRLPVRVLRAFQRFGRSRPAG